MSNHDDEEVGYKNPPKHTQFKKGQSGNPNGRPKKSKNVRFREDINKLIMKDAQTDMSLQINGELTTLSSFEAVLMALRNKALKGDSRAAKLYTDLIKQASIEEKEYYEEILSVLLQNGARLRNRKLEFDLKHLGFDQTNLKIAQIEILRYLGDKARVSTAPRHTNKNL